MNSNDKSIYNTIPVVYCKYCLSLKIHSYQPYGKCTAEEGIVDDYDYCGECGSTNIDSCSIEEYQELYKSKYGYYPLEIF